MKKSKAKQIATWDCETDPFKDGRPVYPFINGFFDGEIYRYFCDKPNEESTNIEQFIEFLREADIEYLIYAHNGGKFDFLYLLPYLDEKIKVIDGRLSKATITLDRQGKKPIKHELRDSFLILPLGLSAHNKEKFDYKILETDVRFIPENLDKTKSYLKSDCIYLHEWVTKFIDRFGRKLTLASAAFVQLEATGYEIPKGAEWYDDQARPYYYGGRVEAIEPGVHKRNINYYDINSAYPRAMLEKHPYDIGFEYSDKPPNDDLMYFAKIRARSKGALPYRENIKGIPKLTFPRDNEIREYLVTSWEIEAGLDTNTLEIIEWLEVLTPKKVKDFKIYVDKFYAEKLEGKLTHDKDLETFAKLMLNSAYGRFAMFPAAFKEYCITESGYAPGKPKNEEELERVMDEWAMIQDEAGYSIWEKDAPSDSWFNVATSASITGWVRAYLWRAICSAERPIYCDTDAIMADNLNVETGNDLGQWKDEGAEDGGIIKAYIGGKKLYALLMRNKKIKKANKGANMSYWDIKKVCNGETVEWVKEGPSFSLRYGQRRLKRNIKMTA